MPVQSSNKTIAKNTAFLYFRMMFTMLVSLFTSRVVLQKLGVEDYGLYRSVGGIVGMLAFLNGALATGSSRFITFALGEGDMEKLKRTFSTTLTIHIVIALIVVIVAETAGLWFLQNKLVIPPDRMDAAIWTFHISVITIIFTLTQVPYGASVIAHEKMSVFAYMSIYDVSAKLLIVYMLSIWDFDKLKLYSLLLFLVSLSSMLFYRIYCIRHFPETRYKFVFDKAILREIGGFSGWSLFAQVSIALNNQGILILLNMFFAPAVVAARAISIQVNMAINQFVNNFRTAVNPQIVKRLAAGDFQGSSHLLLTSTKYSYFIMFLLCFPVCLLASPLLDIWLDIVPEYTVIFLQLIVIQSLFQVFDTSFYTALYAKGRLQENALISPTIGFLCFPVVYVLFRLGFPPVAMSWAILVNYVILGVIIKPILIVKIAHYKWIDILGVYKTCIRVTLLALPLPLIINHYVQVNTILGFIAVALSTVIITGAVILYVGINKKTREKFYAFALNKIRRKQ